MVCASGHFVKQAELWYGYGPRLIGERVGLVDSARYEKKCAQWLRDPHSFEPGAMPRLTLIPLIAMWFFVIAASCAFACIIPS